MKNYLIDLYQFYKKPHDERIKDYSLNKNIKYILYTSLVDFALFLLLFPFLHYLLENNLIPEDIEKISYKDNTIISSIIIIAVLVPIMEEIIFRLPLRYNRFYALFMPRKIWNYIFKVLIYSIPFIFGIVHLTNYGEITLSLLKIAPILVGSQIIGGYLFTFLRVRFNFISAVLSHCLWNLSISIYLLITSSFEKPYSQTTENYDVKIKYFEYNNLEKQKLVIDSNKNRIFRIEANQYSINHLVDSLTNKERKKTDFIIDLKLESKKGITKDEFIDIINRYDLNNK